MARLNRVVNDVLDFARPITFDFAPADLNASVPRVRPGCPGHARRCPSPSTRTRPSARVTDAERLRTALVNVIVNARHAVEGQQAQRVTLTTRLEGDTVMITIADTGPGIERANPPQIFDLDDEN